MKKVKLSITVLVFIIMIAYIILNMYHHNSKITQTDLFTNNSNETEIKTISLNELRNVYRKNLEDVKNGLYNNLETNHPLVMIADNDNIYKIEEKSNTWYREIDLLELVERETDIIKQLIGDDINMDYLWDDTSWYYTDDEYNLHYPTYSETIESIKNGTYTPNDFVAQYCTYPYMAYVGATIDVNDLRYCHVPCDFDNVVFMKGKLFEIMNGEVIDDLESECDPIVVYYKNDKEIKDEYQLSNGKISIEDAIDFVEDYFEKKYPYNINNDIKQVVYKVEVFDIGNDIYALEFAITRQFEGLVADSGQTSGKMDAEFNTYAKDDTRVIMVENNEVDIRIGTGNGNCMECVGEPMTEVVSLESALQIVSNSIGMNSKYEIEEISMIFRRKIVNGTLYQQEYEGIPSWKIRCINVADGKETRFYINLKDGKLEYYVND